MTYIDRPFRFLKTPFLSALLSACATFLLLSARLTDAGPGGPRKHGAISEDVSVVAPQV